MIRTNKSPKVCIRCITYNHEAYIRDCLEGFVMQKTNFPYIAIVHDDASTDGTASIIREYAERYPDIIKPIYEIENQYSKPDNLLGKLMNKACLETGASYIAMCEGDDYWTDPHKLQKQVDFLESHPDYSLVFHKVEVIEDWSGKKQDLFDFLEEKRYTGENVIQRWTVPTCSAMYRIKVLETRPYDRDFRMGDNVIWLTCARWGKIFCLRDCMGVYRRNQGGWTVNQCGTIEKQQDLLLHFQALQRHFPEVNPSVFERLTLPIYISITRFYIIQLSKNSFRYILRGIRLYGAKFLFKLIQSLNTLVIFKCRQWLGKV